MSDPKLDEVEMEEVEVNYIYKIYSKIAPNEGIKKPLPMLYAQHNKEEDAKTHLANCKKAHPHLSFTIKKEEVK